MNIKNLKIENFIGINSIDIEFDKPVNLFLGKNNQGKSSLVHAMLFPFTGRCLERGYNKKNQAKQLRNDPDEKFTIQLGTPEGVLEATESKQPKQTITPEEAEIIFRPQSVLYMEPKSRQAIFGEIQKHTGAEKEIESLMEAEGFASETVEKVKVNMDIAQEWAVEQRRIAKRTIKETEANIKELPPSVIEVGYKTVDLEKFKMEEIESRLRQRQNELKEVERLLIEDSATLEASDAEEVSKILAQQKKALEEIDEKELAAIAEQAGKKVDVYQQELKQINDRTIELETEVSLNKDRIKKIKALEGICPHCEQPVTDEIKIKLIDDYQEHCRDIPVNINQLKRKKEEIEAILEVAIEKYNEAESNLSGMEQQRENIIKEIKRWEIALSNISQRPIREEKKEGLENKISNLELLLKSIALYESAKLLKQQGNIKIKQQNEIIENMDKLDELLKPDGELRKIAAGSLGGLDIDQKLASSWSMANMELRPNGEIWYDNRPIESASASEKYRASVLLAEVLCRTLNYGIMVLDGLEVLDKDNRRKLLQRMPEWTEKIQSVFLLMTADNRQQKIPQLPWLQTWWVENGSVVLYK